MMESLGLYNYWVVVVLMMTGFYIVVARDNLITVSYTHLTLPTILLV